MLEPFERRMYSARGHISLKARLHGLQDRTTIGVLV
jgi:hypothetical protein